MVTGHSLLPVSPPLPRLEIEMLDDYLFPGTPGVLTRPMGEGDVLFTRTDGRTVFIENVRVDSIGPRAEAPGVIGVEFFDRDDIVHVPFVQYWVINY